MSAVAAISVSLSANAYLMGDELDELRHRFESQVSGIIENNCILCHSGIEANAGLDLSQYKSFEDTLENWKIWRLIGQRVFDGEMPPPGHLEIETGDRQSFIDWLDRVFGERIVKLLDRPGPPMVRRLTKYEYRNSLKYLFSDEEISVDNFPADEVSAGFDNSAAGRSLSPILLEKYLAKAEEITARAIFDVEAAKLDITKTGSQLRKTSGSFHLRTDQLLSQNGTISTEIDILATGKYKVAIEAWGQQAGPHWVEMGIEVDGRQRGKTKVKSTEELPGKYKITIKLAAGKHRVGVSFNNDYHREKAQDPAERDRNLVVRNLSISGPLDFDVEQFSKSHRQIVFVRPDSITTAEQATRKIAERFASRAFRRPPKKNEIRRLVKVFNDARKNGQSFDQSIQVMLQSVLISPNFLYRIDTMASADALQGPIDTYDLAANLSYFLWSEPPDKELNSLAADGQIANKAILAQQVKRMLDDPRVQAVVDNFAEQWLQLRALNTTDPDPDLFPAFDRKLLDDMRSETKLLFADALKNDLSLIELINASHTFLNNRLGEHYGISADVDGEFRKVDVAGTSRGGLLGHASILTVSSNPIRTSPVKRGKWILEVLIGQPPPPPLPDVPQLPERSKLTGSLRERMEQHRSDPRCASCHSKMDALGFALENFDAIGQRRETDNGKPIDASFDIAGLATMTGIEQLKSVLVEHYREEIYRNFAEKLLVYALGRSLEFYDQSAVNRIVEYAERHDGRMRSFFTAVALSSAFSNRDTSRGQSTTWLQQQGLR